MNKLLTVAAVVSACVAGTANAEVKQYVSGKLSLGSHTLAEETSVSGITIKTQDTNLNTNIGLNAAYGVKVSGFRVEAEANLATPSSDAAGNNLYNTSILLNGYYDFDVSNGFILYVGAGFGYNRAVLEFTNDDEWAGGGPAWQLGGGVAFPLDENWTLDFGYRYFSGGSIEKSVNNIKYKGDASAGELKAGIRCFF